jgi:hypothetical protein
MLGIVLGANAEAEQLALEGVQLPLGLVRLILMRRVHVFEKLAERVAVVVGMGIEVRKQFDFVVVDRLSKREFHLETLLFVFWAKKKGHVDVLAPTCPFFYS